MNHLHVAFESFGKRVLGTTRQAFAHLKEALGSRQSVEPAAVADDEGADAEAEVKDHFSEKGISTQLLRISALAVGFKALHYLVDRKWLLTLTSGISSILEAPSWLWAMISSLTGAFIPLVCGMMMAAITWYTVFLDRCIPGVYTPSSASVRKHWFSPPSTLHLGHGIAMANALILTLLMYFGWTSTSTV